MLILVNRLKIKRIGLLLFIIVVLCISYFLQGEEVITTSINIEDPDEEELEKIAQWVFDNRNKANLGKIEILEGMYDKGSTNGLWAYEREIWKREYLDLWAEKQSVEFKNIDSKVFLRSVNQIENGYQVGLAVTTEYIYDYKNEDVDENSFRIGTYHSLDIVENKGKWLISGEWYQDPFISSSDVVNIARDNINKIIPSKEKKDLTNIDNQRKKAIEYADNYCGVARPPDYNFHYNENYKNYNSLGGNCTNFVSQTIHEAGMDSTLAWNYKNGEGSEAWVNASEFHNYMLYSGRGTLIANGTYEEVLESSYELLPGDYIAYEKNGRVGHNAVVTGVDSKGYTLVNTHNPDFYRVPWDLGWNNEEIRFWLVRVNY
ncbi:MAG TPA: amidase domain-containing protein [Tissierellaceae bacterium]|nr:amidase domain-containing protein [Tissierellaceae bacterium]